MAFSNHEHNAYMLIVKHAVKHKYHTYLKAQALLTVPLARENET